MAGRRRASKRHKKSVKCALCIRKRGTRRRRTLKMRGG